MILDLGPFFIVMPHVFSESRHKLTQAANSGKAIHFRLLSIARIFRQDSGVVLGTHIIIFPNAKGVVQ